MKTTVVTCDICGDQCSEGRQLSVKDHKFKDKRVDVFVSVGTERSDICKYCAIEIVKSLDDRPVVE